MQSMTGFGRAEGEACGLFVEIMLRAVNHKSLDLSFRLPRRLYPLEGAFREKLQQQLSRGRVEVSVQLRPGQAALTTLVLDEARVDAVKEALDQIVRRHRLEHRPQLQDLLLIPDLFVEEPAQLDEEALEHEVLNIFQQAIDAFLSTRMQEADALKEQLRKNLTGIRESMGQLEEQLPAIREEAGARIRAKVQEFLRENPDQQEGRLQQELLFYLDKSDVQEELTRLSSHLDQFENLLEEKGPVGKKMDFLAQEMNREANTIASKSQHLVQTGAAIELKVHVEQMREQILNLE